METILTHDIFVFDFDGVIVDSEKIHNHCWNIALQQYNISFPTFNHYDYCKIFHTNVEDGIKINLLNHYNINNFDEIRNNKNLLYKNYITNNEIDLIKGIENFLILLKNNNKKIIIASNTNREFIDHILQKYLTHKQRGKRMMTLSYHLKS